MGNRFAKEDTTDVILLEGIIDSGRTTLLSKLKPDAELYEFGSHHEKVDVCGVTLTIWDLVGRDRTRPVFLFYGGLVRGVVYVIDSANKENRDEGLDDLVEHILLGDKVKGAVVMVLANKQDLPGAMSALEIQKAITKRYKFSPRSSFAHTVFVRPCSVLTMEGVNEAFQDFVEQLRLKDEGQPKQGLLPLVSKRDDKKAKDLDSGKLGGQKQTDSLDHSKIKRFFKNPFCLFKTNG